jgi:hypothetical protein
MAEDDRIAAIKKEVQQKFVQSPFDMDGKPLSQDVKRAIFDAEVQYRCEGRLPPIATLETTDGQQVICPLSGGLDTYHKIHLYLCDLLDLRPDAVSVRFAYNIAKAGQEKIVCMLMSRDCLYALSAKVTGGSVGDWEHQIGLSGYDDELDDFEDDSEPYDEVGELCPDMNGTCQTCGEWITFCYRCGFFVHHDELRMAPQGQAMKEKTGKDIEDACIHCIDDPYSKRIMDNLAYLNVACPHFMYQAL